MFRSVFSIALIFAIAFAARTAEEQSLDAVSKQAAVIEGELGEVRDTSPEAADLMVKLVDLYHANGRVFGLIWAGDTLVTKHPTHPQHKVVMLKLIDGLQAMSRNKELTAATRQFLQRYPQDPECPRLEEVLASALNQQADRLRTAEAYEAVYRRQPGTPKGQAAGVTAISLYNAANTPESYLKLAQLAEAMLDSLPPSEAIAHVAWQGVQNWRRLHEWAKSNAIASKMLAKVLPADPQFQREVHYYMSESYQSLMQWANAADAIKKMRALKDDYGQMWRQAYYLHNAQVAPAELEPIVAEMVAKEPKRNETLQARSFLGQAYIRAMDKPKAIALFKDLINDDATNHSNAALFAQQTGTEPAQMAEAEQALLAAIERNPKQAYYLRYILATEIYANRIKDVAKSRQVLMDLIMKSPADEGHTQIAFNTLLGAPASEDEFKAVVAQWVKLRKEHPEWNSIRGWLPGWATAAEATAELKPRAEYVRQQVATLDNEYDKKWAEAQIND